MDLIHKMLKFMIVMCLCACVFGRIGFVKDQRLDLVEFPPRTLQVFHSGVPTGHMRPLGNLTFILFCFSGFNQFNTVTKNVNMNKFSL